MKYLKMIISFVVIMILVICFLFYRNTILKSNEKLGIQTLRALYEFNSLDEFEENMRKFEDYVSEDVFQQMTIDNSDRVLGVYLKLKGNSCAVDIVDSTSDYIVYHLISDSIEKERLFLFCYKVSNKKIIDIKEAELFLFPTTRGWSIKQ